MTNIINATTIPIIISTIAILISLFALIETVRSRKKKEQKNLLQQKLASCNEALNILVFDSISKDSATQSFNELYSVKMVVEKNMLFLPEKAFQQYYKRLMDIVEDYSRVSGNKLNQYSKNLQTTCLLYNKEDFPIELHCFYKDVLHLAQKQQLDLTKQIEEL